MLRFLSFSLLCLVAVSACETVVVIDVPQKDNLLVLNGLVIADQQTIMRVNRSWPVFNSDGTESYFLSGASLSLYEDGLYVGPIVETSGGVYAYDYAFDTSFVPKPERLYRIEASHPDFPSAFAETTTPPNSVPMDLSLGDTVSLGGDPHLEVLLDIEDPGYRSDFYAFELFLESPYYSGLMCFRNTEESFDGSFDFFPDIGQLPIFCQKVYLTDEGFNGVEKRIRFLVPLEDFDVVPLGPGSTLRCVVGLYSQELYRYNLEEQLQLDSEGNPFAQPVVVEDNVEGGFGLVGGFSATAAVLIL